MFTEIISDPFEWFNCHILEILENLNPINYTAPKWGAKFLKTKFASFAHIQKDCRWFLHFLSYIILYYYFFKALENFSQP